MDEKTQEQLELLQRVVVTSGLMWESFQQSFGSQRKLYEIHPSQWDSDTAIRMGEFLLAIYKFSAVFNEKEVE